MLIRRMIRAALLDPELYNEVKQDQRTTWQAFAVVFIVTLCTVAAGVIVPNLTRGSPISVRGVLSLAAMSAGNALIGWLIWVAIILVVARVLGERATLGEAMRPLAFADTVNILNIFTSVTAGGPLIWVLTIGQLVGLATWLWMAAATVIALRAAMGFGTGKAVRTVIITTMIGF